MCLQADVVSGIAVGDQYESEQLGEQLGEIEYQITLIEKQEREALDAIASKADLVASLTSEIDERMVERVTPRLQAYADAAAKAATAAERQKAIERVLMQWDRAEDLTQKTESLTAERARLQREVAEAESHLAQRKTEIFDELDAEFQTTVADFGIPSIQSASIDRDSYLPILTVGRSAKRATPAASSPRRRWPTGSRSSRSPRDAMTPSCRRSSSSTATPCTQRRGRHRRPDVPTLLYPSRSDPWSLPIHHCRQRAADRSRLEHR